MGKLNKSQEFASHLLYTQDNGFRDTKKGVQSFAKHKTCSGTLLNYYLKFQPCKEKHSDL